MATQKAKSSVHPLRTYRKGKGLTLAKMADILGCHESLLSQIENGKRVVTKNNAKGWGKITGIPRLTLLFPKEYTLEGKPIGQ